MSRYWDLFYGGWRCLPPSEEADKIDGDIISKMKCPSCGTRLTYYPFTKGNRYIALAKCHGKDCGYETEI